MKTFAFSKQFYKNVQNICFRIHFIGFGAQMSTELFFAVEFNIISVELYKNVCGHNNRLEILENIL